MHRVRVIMLREILYTQLNISDSYQTIKRGLGDSHTTVAGSHKSD
jgi:hypothetical protein